MNKQETYTEVLQHIEALIDGETDLISVMSTVACELFHAFEHWNWVGFYRNVGDNTLKVGPYQGGHGCLTIDFNRGVCGRCATDKAIQLHNDVTALPYHIACSSQTMAEIVLPIVNSKNEIVAVFDIDSVQANVFDETDIQSLSKIVSWIEARL